MEGNVDINWQLVLFVLGVGVLTAVSSFWDLRTRRIPNKLTLPAFFLGLIYQVVFNGWGRPGLADAGLAFVFGFGTLFVLWLVGGGGGGDVKLMGALSVWLGFHMTFWVLVISTLFVIGGTLAVMMLTAVTRGAFQAKKKLAAEESTPEIEEDAGTSRQQRRIMAYALPVTLATWIVVIWKLPTFS